MRRQSILVVVGALVLFVSSQAIALIQYNDGQTYDITTTINDDVWVDWGTPSMATTVNLLGGGNIPPGYGMRAYEDSVININGGSLGDDFWVYNRSQVDMSDGYIGSYVTACDDSQFSISGGTIASMLYSYNNAQIEVSGGSIAQNVEAYDTSHVSISGGTMGRVKSYDNTQTVIFDGTVGGLYFYDSAQGEVSGGTISNITALGSSQVTFAGGTLENDLEAEHSSHVTFSGGLVQQRITAGHNGILTIVGSNFAVDGTTVGYGELYSLLGGDRELEPHRRLTGTLLSGEPIDNDFYISYDAKIILTPDPISERVIHNITQDTYYETIQAAIDDANEHDTIEVPVGTHTGDGNRDIDFKGKVITVRSEDANDPSIVAATIIDCNGTETEPHRGFYFHSGEDTNSILDGLTITNGYGPNEPTHSTGGAMYCNNSSPAIRNCIITGNYSAHMGGGIDCNDSHAVIENCTFKENESLDTGGGLYNRLSSITVADCQFIDNSAAYGAGMYSVDSAPTVTYSIFTGNSATGKGGAVCNNRVSSALVNCVLVGNEAPEGGAIHNRDSETAVVTSCIVWGNSASEIEGSAQITYCDVKGGYPGEGNIDADPCFADHNAGDYHLKSQAGRWDAQSQEWVRDDATSLCIDAGDPFSLVGRELFPNGGRVNMGIYGGTAEASKSYFGEPVCEEAIGGDVNGDCRVDFRDFWIMALHWCEDNNP